MADGLGKMSPLNTKQFSSTFLDIRRNSRGYVNELRAVDKDSMKKMLSPFPLIDKQCSPCKCTTYCHSLGNAMWNFAQQCKTLHYQSRSQSTSGKFQGDCNIGRSANDCVGDDGGDNDDDDNEDSDDKNDDDMNGDGDNDCFQLTSYRADGLSHDLLLSASSFLVNSNQLGNEKDKSSEESVASMLYCSGTKMADVDLTDTLACSNIKSSNGPQHVEPHIKPLTYYKQPKASRENISPSLTLNLNLDALKAVLHTGIKILENGGLNASDVCGKIAVLHGFQEEGTGCISVVEGEVMGLYNHVTGAVWPCKQRSAPDDFDFEVTKDPFPPCVNSSVDLSKFFDQSYSISKAPLLQTIKSDKAFKKYSPIAWLLTSPAIGVKLDWQVQEKVLKWLKQRPCKKASVDEQLLSVISRADQCSKQWYNVLVIVDEYRCVEKDIPLLEVYKLCANGVVNVVNFDVN